MSSDPRRPGDPRPPLPRVGGWLLAFWVALWLLDSVKDWVGARLIDQPFSLGHAFIAQIPWWGAWVLLTPIVAVLAWRFPPTGARWRLRLAGHTIAGVAISLSHMALASVLFQWRAGALTGARVYRDFVAFFLSFTMYDFIAYLGMVGAVAAWTYHRGMRAREREAVQLAVRTSELERAMSEAKLEALRRQLHPHFLFNTLNTVAGLARGGETERVTSMLERLGDLLRLRLDDEQPDEITLERELEWMDHYLAIERERFGDRLDVETSVPRELHRALVPAMVLQPLVENAVRHGISADQGRGLVAVRARRSGDRLLVTVSDSGPGFEAVWSSDGIGLSNTRARLAQLYGEDATLRAGNGGGGSVTIDIPWHTERVAP